MMTSFTAFLTLVVKTIFYSLASFIRKILFSPLEDKIPIFAPPCNISRTKWTFENSWSLQFIQNISTDPGLNLSHFEKQDSEILPIEYWAEEDVVESLVVRIGSTPTFLYFDLYLYSAYAGYYV